MMLENLKHRIEDKKVCLLGFGLEGQSTYHYIRNHLPDFELTVADRNESIIGSLSQSIIDDPKLTFICGESYLTRLDEFDFIIKSPGITLHTLNGAVPRSKLSSQTDIFLEAFHEQVIGVTGTKGKSTTASLTYHLISQETDNVVLLGNIGTPPFDYAGKIDKETIIVFELSSHQLEILTSAPGTAILLNLLPEHLDHFKDIRTYYESKLNIVKYQTARDFLIFNVDDAHLAAQIAGDLKHENEYLYSLNKVQEKGAYLQAEQIICKLDDYRGEFQISDFPLKGKYNLLNLMAALLACKLRNIKDDSIIRGVASFKGLRHRLEYIGEYGGIQFFNDSIATIPEASMEAVRALKKVDTLILGGFDRNIDFTELISFLIQSEVRNIICTGEAGRRMHMELQKNKAKQSLFYTDDFKQIFEIIKARCNPGGICLLSPAAASYDMFKNFEERGDLFTTLAKSI